MTPEQAQALLMAPELSGLDAHLQQIGNGEYVVVVHRKVAGDYYLWGEADLAAVKRE